MSYVNPQVGGNCQDARKACDVEAEMVVISISEVADFDAVAVEISGAV